MAADITSSVEIKKRLREGWELWYVHNRKYPNLPGEFEMRYQNQWIPVHWDAIDKCRRNLDWFKKNTDEIEVGKDWCYKAKQKDLLAALPAESSGGVRCTLTN